MTRIHEEGWTQAIYNSEQRKLLQKTMYFTSEERFLALEELLKVIIPTSPERAFANSGTVLEAHLL